jgi:hypothetical protein
MLVIGTSGDLEVLDNDWAARIHPGCPTRISRCCGRVLCECCFRRKSEHRSVLQRFMPDCIICEYNAREQYRRENVFAQAARTRLDDHRRRERDEGLHSCDTLAEYEVLTGIRVEWLAEEMRRAWENDERCHHCESVGRAAHWQAICPVIEGVPDLTRMTIDRIDRTRRLDRGNIRLMCLSGNISRNDTDEAVYAIRQAYWRMHNAYRGAA